MKNKKKSGWGKSIIQMLLFIPNIIFLVSNVVSLICIEARLAGKSFFMILVLSVFFASIVMSIWLCLLLLLFIASVAHLGPTLSIVLLILVNILLLLIVGLIISKLKNNLTFPATREQLSHLSDGG